MHYDVIFTMQYDMPYQVTTHDDDMIWYATSSKILFSRYSAKQRKVFEFSAADVMCLDTMQQKRNNIMLQYDDSMTCYNMIRNNSFWYDMKWNIWYNSFK